MIRFLDDLIDKVLGNPQVAIIYSLTAFGILSIVTYGVNSKDIVNIIIGGMLGAMIPRGQTPTIPPK